MSSTISAWRDVTVCWGPFAKCTNSRSITTVCWASCFNSYSRKLQNSRPIQFLSFFLSLFIIIIYVKTWIWQSQQVARRWRRWTVLHWSRAIRKRPRRVLDVLFQMPSINFRPAGQQSTQHVKLMRTLHEIPRILQLGRLTRIQLSFRCIKAICQILLRSIYATGIRIFFSFYLLSLLLSLFVITIAWRQMILWKVLE